MWKPKLAINDSVACWPQHVLAIGPLQGMIPLVIHVDGAEFYANSEYLCWSVGSALAVEHVLDTKLPICVLPHASMVDQDVKLAVHRTVATVLSWSLSHCSAGTVPTTGPFGEPLGDRANLSGSTVAGGWRGCFFAYRFDEKARVQVNYFNRSYNHSLICMRCLAQREHKNWFPQMSYKNFHWTAAYRLTPISRLAGYFQDCQQSR